jgi:hypothetical protein
VAPVLQQEHSVARVLGELVGQHGAGGFGADDDVVEVHHHTSCFLFKDLSAEPARSPPLSYRLISWALAALLPGAAA